ncbi:MAG TPA: HD domain-containing protein [Phycisphaerales bacterium]|nr:HD domain-containing protein [Phycisphaerales bacterium]
MIDATTKTLSATQFDCLEKFADRLNGLTVNFAVFDTYANCFLNFPCGTYESDFEQLEKYVNASLRQHPEKVHSFGPSGEVLTVGLMEDGKVIAVAAVDTTASFCHDNEDLRRLCQVQNVDYQMFHKAFHDISKDSEYISAILTSFAHEFKAASKAAVQLEQVSTELTQSYEELILLYNMSTNMKVTQSNATYLQMACDQITRSVNVEGIAIFLEKERDEMKSLLLTAGSGVVTIDNMAADILQVNLLEELGNGNDALLDSEVDSPFKYEWPETVKSIIAVPLRGSDKIMGMMVAINAVEKPDFDSIDIKLFSSVANQCAVFIENNRLFGDLKDLFIGSLKALTNSIDAKDQYTRGHSDRVAFISRWIAERYAEKHTLEEDDIHRIYLAGLLHDIGKIGINESVLLKKGAFNEDDRSQIEVHPRIGAAILADIKQMKDIIPGVLSHHERPDGKGYPRGLTDEQIPLIGKIIGLADAFDAMTSRRVYRDAMSIKRATAEIEKNLGTQFDSEVGRIFLDSDIKKLWEIIQDGFIERWDYSNFSEYGAIAVGTLIR